MVKSYTTDFIAVDERISKIAKSMFLKLLRKKIYYWFPVLPFVAYWICAYLAFHFGPFVTPVLTFETHIYFVLCLFLFAISYKLGLGGRIKNIDHHYSADNIVALKLLWRTSWPTFIGTLMLLVDRMTSGAGSFDLVQNNMAAIRDNYAGKITLLTTIGVLPQSFYLITLATYFYCGMHRLPIPKIVHLLIFSTFVCQILNMVLSANRGVLFWIATYVAFYLFFCARINLLKVIFSRKNIFKVAFAATFCIVSWMYFLFVAQHRVSDTTAIYKGQHARSLLKDSQNSNYDYAALGAKYQLFYYGTHSFEYVDVILKNASVINLDFLSPLGIRVESQIVRFFPGYRSPAIKDIRDWEKSAGLNTSGWVSIFGASLVFFGILGSLLFFIGIGFFSGYSTRRCIQSNRLGWLIIVFTIYVSFTSSFDWILKDFHQYLAFFVGAYLILNRRRSLSRRRVIVDPGLKTAVNASNGD